MSSVGGCVFFFYNVSGLVTIVYGLFNSRAPKRFIMWSRTSWDTLGTGRYIPVTTSSLKAIKCVWEALNFELIWTITLNLYWVNYLLTTTNTITGGGSSRFICHTDFVRWGGTYSSLNYWLHICINTLHIISTTSVSGSHSLTHTSVLNVYTSLFLIQNKH